MLLEQPCTAGTFWNVNFPHPEPDGPEPEIVFCPLEAGPLPLVFRVDGDCLHYAGNYHERRRQPGSNVDICFGGKIAITRLALYG